MTLLRFTATTFDLINTLHWLDAAVDTHGPLEELDKIVLLPPGLLSKLETLHQTHDGVLLLFLLALKLIKCSFFLMVIVH